MEAVSKTRQRMAIGVPALIFTACTLITFSSKFKAHGNQLSIAILIDLLIVAPLAYYLIIRKTSLSKSTVLRVFMLGTIVATAILSKTNSEVLSFVNRYLAPIAEVVLIGFLVWKFNTAKKHLKANQPEGIDFLPHCRSTLFYVFGNEKLANIFASEIAVFYYIFKGREKNIDNKNNFTCYKENGILLVLGTFLGLFMVETIGMHFVFQLWNKTAAWIFTIFGFYSCLQLLAHLKALRSRPVVINNNNLTIRNGLMGGDAVIALTNIKQIIPTNKPVGGNDVVKIAFIKGLENHNVAIYLKEPVAVIKAFGIKKQAGILLVSIDQHQKFIESIESGL